MLAPVESVTATTIEPRPDAAACASADDGGAIAQISRINQNEDDDRHMRTHDTKPAREAHLKSF
jgi:hypothetical protein